MILKNKKHVALIIWIVIVFAILLLPHISYAAEGVLLRNVSNECISSGKCKPCDVIKLIVGIGQFIMGIVGGLTLLFFTYGGWLWLVSGGNKDKIGKGKTIFINSSIGLLIVLFAYVIISGIVALLTGGSFGDWSSIC